LWLAGPPLSGYLAQSRLKSPVEVCVLEAILIAAIVYLLWVNYQLQKRWRALRYCWQVMSDFACEGTKIDDQPDFRWKEAVKRQISFLRRFKVVPLNERQLRHYEVALLDRNIEPPVS
jgi:hypothetical protein